MPTTKIKCPMCGRPQVPGEGQRIFWCEWCKMQFDDEPEEGGDFDDRYPDRRLIRDERRKENQQRKRR